MLRAILILLGLQQLHLDLAFDVYGKTWEQRPMIIHISQKTADKFSDSSFGLRLIRFDPHRLLIIQVWLYPTPQHTRLTGISEIEKADAAYVGRIDMIEHVLHLLLGTTHGEETQEQTEGS
jgi:hypothetical protein